MRTNYCGYKFPPPGAHYLLEQMDDTEIAAYMEFINETDEYYWIRPVPIEDEIEYE